MGESTLVFSRPISTFVDLILGNAPEDGTHSANKSAHESGRRVVLELMQRNQVVLPEIDPEVETKIVAMRYLEEHSPSQAFFLINLARVYDQYAHWMQNLGMVTPFYAVKCNPDSYFLYLLSELGCNFDCASLAEMRTVLKMGIDPERIIFANPCKKLHHLRWARNHGVKKMTFDNEAELDKIKSIFPDAELLLRIATDDSTSVCRFSMKFGLAPECAEQVLRKAMELDLKVIGVSFHVGSGCRSPHLYELAIADARKVFAVAEMLGMQKLHILDIGGGFPGEKDSSLFASIAQTIRLSIARHFPRDGFGADVEVIAEPGRFFATSTHTLFTCIYARKEAISEKGTERHQTLYVDDGVYGSFNSILYDHANPVPEALPVTSISGTVAKDSLNDKNLYQSTIFGPTCDGLDNLTPQDTAPLPKLEIGDYLMWRDMGAYTSAASGYNFNGMEGPLVFYMFQ